jgi:hypothetical protein
MELVLNPAKQEIVLKDKRGVILLFVMKPLFSRRGFLLFQRTSPRSNVGRNARTYKKGEISA